MSSKPSSLERAFQGQCDAGGEAAFRAPPSAEQLDLLRDDDGRLPANVFQIMRSAERKAGRPAGSKNKRSEVISKLQIQKWGDPLDFLGSIWTQPLDQGCELLLAAEGGREKENALFERLERLDEILAQGLKDGWSDKRISAIERALASMERAASHLKSRPGELSLKLLAIQKDAAKEHAQYIHSKKPVEVQASGSVDFRAIVVGGNAPADPGPQVQRNLVDAINSGVIGERDLAAIRIIDGDFHVVDDDDEGAA